MPMRTIADFGGEGLPPIVIPGGYTIVYVTPNNEVLCPKCANTTLQDEDEYDDWKPSHWFQFDEGQPVECSACGEMLYPSYYTEEVRDA